MQVNEMKERLHSLIEATDNDTLLQQLLVLAETKTDNGNNSEFEELSNEDFNELMLLAKEAPLKDTISHTELRSSLNRWFTR